MGGFEYVCESGCAGVTPGVNLGVYPGVRVLILMCGSEFGCVSWCAGLTPGLNPGVYPGVWVYILVCKSKSGRAGLNPGVLTQGKSLTPGLNRYGSASVCAGLTPVLNLGMYPGLRVYIVGCAGLNPGLRARMWVCGSDSGSESRCVSGCAGLTPGLNVGVCLGVRVSILVSGSESAWSGLNLGLHPGARV